MAIKIVLFSIIFVLESTAASKVAVFSTEELGFWTKQPRIPVIFTPTGKISFNGDDRLFEIKEKNDKITVWNYQSPYKTYNEDVSGTITAHRNLKNGPISLITIESKKNSENWSDVITLTDHSPTSSIIRRTICRDRKCFLINQDVCKELIKAESKSDIGELIRAQTQCVNIASKFSRIFNKKEDLDKLQRDFELDLSKLSGSNNFPGIKKSLVLGKDIEASAANLLKYLEHCRDIIDYNDVAEKNTYEIWSPDTHSKTIQNRTRQ